MQLPTPQPLADISVSINTFTHFNFLMLWGPVSSLNLA